MQFAKKRVEIHAVGVRRTSEHITIITEAPSTCLKSKTPYYSVSVFSGAKKISGPSSAYLYCFLLCAVVAW
jgi:hypothetical protein